MEGSHDKLLRDLTRERLFLSILPGLVGDALISYSQVNFSLKSFINVYFVFNYEKLNDLTLCIDCLEPKPRQGIYFLFAMMNLGVLPTSLRFIIGDSGLLLVICDFFRICLPMITFLNYMKSSIYLKKCRKVLIYCKFEKNYLKMEFDDANLRKISLIFEIMYCSS